MKSIAVIIKKVKDSVIRSRARWVKEGEISSKYFLSPEKKGQNHNVIKELKTAKGQTVHSDKDILKEAHTFYSDLYTSSKTSISDINNYFEKNP